VLKSHVGAIDIVRPENQHAIKKLTAEIDRHDLADELSRGLGITRVQRIGYDERRAFISRDFGRRLVNLQTRCHDKSGNVSSAAGFDNVRYAANADINKLTRTRVVAQLS
jgi:hypothetical protein